MLQELAVSPEVLMSAIIEFNTNQLLSATKTFKIEELNHQLPTDFQQNKPNEQIKSQQQMAAKETRNH